MTAPEPINEPAAPAVPGWKRRLVLRSARVENAFDRLVFDLKRRTHLLSPLEVHAYRGHGTTTTVWARARVMERTGSVKANATHTSLQNLRNMARRFLSPEIPRARAVARFHGAELETIADEEGFLQVELHLPEPLPARTAWHNLDWELTWPVLKRYGPARGTARVLVVGEADFAVISDLDDTVIQSGVTRLGTMLRIALLSNAYTRLPFEGVAAFYRALQRGPDGKGWNPIFYVSAGPWNLADMLEDFLDHNGVPRGPLFLRDWSPLTLKGRTKRHKLAVIRQLITAYPELPFVLIGDSGEHDPEIYAAAVREHPGRIKAIYIRDVTTGSRRTAEVVAMARELAGLGTEMVVSSDTAAAAAHARESGLIAPQQAEATADEAEAASRD